MDRLEYQTVVLGALLHDIGKFLQRGRGLSLVAEGKHPEVSARDVSALPDVVHAASIPDGDGAKLVLAQFLLHLGR